MRAPNDFDIDKFYNEAVKSFDDLRALMPLALQNYYENREWDSIIDLMFQINKRIPITLEDMKETFVWANIVRSTVEIPAECDTTYSDRWEGSPPLEVFDTLYNRLLKKILYSYNIESKFKDEYGCCLRYPLASQSVELYDGTFVSVVVDLDGKVVHNFNPLSVSPEESCRTLNQTAIESVSI